MTISARQLGWWRTRVRSHWSMGSSSASSPSIWRSATPSSCRLAGGSATPASQARVAATAILLEAGQPVMEQGGGGRPDRGGVPRVHPTGLCRAHGSYASRSAEADGNRTRLSRATAHTGFEDLNFIANVASSSNAAGQGMSRSNIIENLTLLSYGSNGDSVPATVPAPGPHPRASLEHHRSSAPTFGIVPHHRPVQSSASHP